MSDSTKLALEITIIAVFSYFSGSLPTGYLIGKLNGIDIRKHGSHNIGATNVRRVLGRDWSIICFTFDFLKGYLPVILFGKYLGAQLSIGAGYGSIVAALAAVCGHIFPIWLMFKGGKGVATSLGVVTGIAFIPVLIGGIIWLIVFNLSRIVSLASMISVSCIAIIAFFLKILGHSNVSWQGIILLAVVAALVVVRHKDNIIRIRNGTESKFVKKKKESENDSANKTATIQEKKK